MRTKLDQMPTDKIYYIAHPYSNGPGTEEDNRADEFLVSERLRAAGLSFISPLQTIPPELNWDEAMDIAKKLMSAADAVFLSGDWALSKGCQVEGEWALGLGIPIYESVGGYVYIADPENGNFKPYEADLPPIMERPEKDETVTFDAIKEFIEAFSEFAEGIGDYMAEDIE